MPHSDEYKSKKIKRIVIEPLEDGFLYEVQIEKESKKENEMSYPDCDILKYALSSADEVAVAVKDDLESQHARKGKKPPIGEGGRFKDLTHELEEEGAKDPKALAAFIGRKKYGSEKFSKLAMKGRK